MPEPSPLAPDALALLQAIALDDLGAGVVLGSEARDLLDLLAASYLVQACPMPGCQDFHVLLLPAGRRLLASRELRA